MRYLRALLFVSLAANVFLFATCTSKQTPVAAPRGSSTTESSPTTEPVRTSERKPAPAGRDISSLPRDVVEQRLVAAEAKAAELESLDKKFAKGTRTIETEARVKPFLDEVFAPFKKGPEPAYRVECRDHVCKLDTDLGDNLANDWMGRLQGTFPGRAIFGEMTFELRPTKTFIELHPPDRIPQEFLGGMMMASLGRARKECGFADAPHGDLSIRLAYNGTKHRVSKQVDGSLSSSPVGDCVAKTVDSVIATTTLPPEMSGSVDVGPWPVSLPLADDERL
ncbi:MAG TPA: hypothetical protein VGM90_02995 [Kofleriaceae bacterium]|jgi:hypothetical protein